MDNFERFVSQTHIRIFGVVLANNALIVLWWAFAAFVLNLNGWLLGIAVTIFAIALTAAVPALISAYFAMPMRLVWQAVLHIAPNSTNVPAPDVKNLHLGQELVTGLITHIYQIAHVVETVERSIQNKPDLRANFIASSLPLPLMVLDAADTVLFANEVMLRYIGRSAEDTIGQNVYSVLDMSFRSDQTFEKWLQSAKATKVTDTNTWERVRLTQPDTDTTKLLDLAAYYNRSNSESMETMVVFFDRTKQYTEDDQAIDFMSLAVHELRTPLTLLRGYIEVFEEEFNGKLNDELQGFLEKMQASSQQLAAFTNNILNVSRFENDQLILKLHEEKIEELITSSVNDMRLRASVQGIELKLNIATKLPTVGADRVGISEVINNLIDNAIKYGGQSKEIIVSVYLNKEGGVETTVQDFGVGIPATALSNLFEKFYRNHRNRSQVGGTGIGLYLAKTIITAHDGQLWVKSKEGKGSIFGFTLKPFSQLADKPGAGDNKDIVRSAHGWIKNHSLYRR
jgi:signal transduction histidine kinase